MPTFKQFTLCSDLFSKYENNWIKVGIAFQQFSKNDSKAILLIENTYLKKNVTDCIPNLPSAWYEKNLVTLIV